MKDSSTRLINRFSPYPDVMNRRIGAYVVDYSILWAVAVLIIYGIFGFSPFDTTQVWNHFIEIALIDLALYFSYAMPLEYHTGATLGKHLFGIVIADRSGHRPTFRQVLLRNIGKKIEMSISILALIFTLNEKHNGKGIGDQFAGTTVVIAAQQQD